MEVKADAQLGAHQGGVAEPAKGACKVARKSGDSRLEKRTTLLTNTGYDNALAETINGLYKAELIHRRAPWKTKEALELATLEWVAWFNHHRLLSSIGYIPPAEAEVNYYRQLAGKNETEVST